MAENTLEKHEEHADEHGEHIGIPGYAAIFGALFVLTIVTYVVSLQDLDGALFPGANTLVALLIAFVKMSLVVLFFMHVRWSPRLIWLTAVSGFFWLAIMFAFTMQDYFTRSTGTF